MYLNVLAGNADGALALSSELGVDENIAEEVGKTLPAGNADLQRDFPRRGSASKQGRVAGQRGGREAWKGKLTQSEQGVLETGLGFLSLLALARSESQTSLDAVAMQ